MSSKCARIKKAVSKKGGVRWVVIAKGQIVLMNAGAPVTTKTVWRRILGNVVSSANCASVELGKKYL